MRRFLNSSSALALIGAAAVMAPAAASAEGFEMRPLLIETSDGLGSLTVSNPGNRRIYIEASIYKWLKGPDGADVLEPSPDAIVSPPATWLEPRSEYRVRLRVPTPPPGKELPFRLVLTQVPSRDDIVSGHVVLAVTQSIPVFAEPDALPPPSLNARVGGPQRLILRNDGGRRVRVSRIVQDGRELMPGLAGYVLGGSALQVDLKAPIHRGRIQFDTDLGPRTLDAGN
jgi:fimbrial chaperone protein